MILDAGEIEKKEIVLVNNTVCVCVCVCVCETEGKTDGKTEGLTEEKTSVRIVF